MTQPVKSIHDSFPSLSALGEYLNTAPRTWTTRYSETSGKTDPSWALGASFPDAVQLARKGWQDGARNLKASLGSLRPTATIRTRANSVAGSRVSAPRFATGNPRCMIRTGEEQTSKPTLTVVCGINALAGADARYMSNYGLALASVVEQLGRRGYPVQVIAALANSFDEGKTRYTVSWTVKHFGQPMNFADMAFSIGHPAAFRRLGFAVMERSKTDTQWDYGRTIALEASDFPGRNVIILNGMKDCNRHSQTPASALMHVQEQVQAAIEAKRL